MHPFILFRFLVVSVVFFSNPLEAAEAKIPVNQSDKELVAATMKALSKCFLPASVKGKFIELDRWPPEEGLLSISELDYRGQIGFVDLYNYIIAISVNRTEVYVRQTGGFGPMPRMFGPIPIDTQCN